MQFLHQHQDFPLQQVRGEILRKKNKNIAAAGRERSPAHNKPNNTHTTAKLPPTREPPSVTPAGQDPAQSNLHNSGVSKKQEAR